MSKRCFPSLLLAALLLLPGAAASADQLYVRNRPYTGFVAGNPAQPSSVEVDLRELCQALDLKINEVNGNVLVSRAGEAPDDPPGEGNTLYVEGTPVAFRDDSGHRLVPLASFASALGAVLKRHAELGTLDFSLTGRDVGSGSMVGPNQLLFFGADWAPASKLFKPNVTEIDKRGLLPVIYIDCTRPRSANYKNFIRYFQGNQIPYTVLLGPGRKVVKSWTGFQEMGAWATELQKLLNSKKT